MNTITVLLGATGLLLVAAVALSFSAMNKKADSSEVAGLRAEIAALEEQQRSLYDLEEQNRKLHELEAQKRSLQEEMQEKLDNKILQVKLFCNTRC